ncbi:NAD(P)-binding protein [Pseudovirgaria hyperparasitica]|uniref:NAD(P)-binding protein n=1 Tax=Pseudovirgaria hyperparasitica TaxID=470096 RepID=A0A6A6VYC2_9PEZI|nr:NAD(P)-binding protein [Pseudovirgaria hyperparasitica]KAF2755263.1 NAD(P)-binding protein [Pseudovirgaria hyperparasitica]
MSKKIVTVLGLTGKQGSSVANHFLKENRWQVRGITRDPESEKAKAWSARGVEVVRAELDDVASLQSAFKGSNAIFAVTDYVANTYRASSDEGLKKAKELGKSVKAYAGILEEIQGVNAAKAASHPEVLSTLERYVFSTLPAVTTTSGGKYTHVYEFDSKANVKSYILSKLPQLAQRMSTVMMSNYLENWSDIPALAPQKEKDGSYSFLFPDIPGDHTAHPELWVTQDAGAFVKALVLGHPAGTDVIPATAIISQEDYAALWSRTLGLPAASKIISEAEYAALVPEEIREELMEMVKYVTEFGMGNVSTATELNIQTTPLEEFIKAQSWQL